MPKLKKTIPNNQEKHRYTFFLEKPLYMFLQKEAEERRLPVTTTLEVLISQWIKEKSLQKKLPTGRRSRA